MGNSALIIVILIFLGIVILSLVLSVTNKSKNKKNALAYLTQYPQSAKVYYSIQKGFSASQVAVFAVDGYAPVPTAGEPFPGVYLTPGQHKLDVTHTSRSGAATFWFGALGSAMSTKTNNNTLFVNIEPNKAYFLAYDPNSQLFSFTERV